MRRALAAVCLLLAAVLPAVAVVSWWSYGQATDTARFTQTARPLASDPDVRREVVDELVGVAGTRLDAVPPALLPGGPATARARVRASAQALVRTGAYRDAWLAVQRSAHARLAARLTGDVRAPLTLDLAPIAAVLRGRVERAGLGPLADAIVDPAPVVLLDRAEVRRARSAADAVRIVRGVAIPAAVLALLGALLTAPRLGVGLVRAAACLAVSTLLVVAARALGRDAVSGGGDVGSLRLAVYDTLTHPLGDWVVGGAVAAVALAVVGAAVAAATRPRRSAPRPVR